VDFHPDPASEVFRAEVRAFLDEHLTPELHEQAHATGTFHDWSFHRAMGDRGFLGAAWPEEWGGQGRDPLQLLALQEELTKAGAPVDGMHIALLVAQTLRRVGSEEQKQAIIPRVLRGEMLLALGYSEPDAGSDVAAVSTRAVRDGDEWVVNGQKMFTTMAHEADHVFLLTRTNPDVAKHKGLTLFLVPLDSPGIEVQPVHTLGGERTNVTFYTDVRVPDSARVGEVDGGWAVLMVALTFERGFSVSSQVQRAHDLTLRWAQEETRPDGGRPIDEPEVRARLARARIDSEVARCLTLRTAWMAANGQLPGVEGSMAKLHACESFQRATAAFLDSAGAEGVRSRTEPDAPGNGALDEEFRHSPLVTIYGGTSEVMRSIVADRRLGLPKS